MEQKVWNQNKYWQLIPITEPEQQQKFDYYVHIYSLLTAIF